MRPQVDPEGRFRIENVAPGTVVLVAKAEGYAESELTTDGVNSGETRPGRPGTRAGRIVKRSMVGRDYQIDNGMLFEAGFEPNSHRGWAVQEGRWIPAFARMTGVGYAVRAFPSYARKRKSSVPSEDLRIPYLTLDNLALP